MDDYFGRLAALVDRPGDLPATGARMAARVEDVLGIDRCMAVLAETLEEVVQEHRGATGGGGGATAPGAAAAGRHPDPSPAGGRWAAGSAP